MPRKPSGKILTVIVQRPQKNGDIYVYERKTQYDPVKKYNRVLSSRLMYKLTPGSSEPVPTRAKRKSQKESLQKESSPEGVHEGPHTSHGDDAMYRIGLTALLAHIGRVSGIDAAVRSSFKDTDALKALSLARYIVASDGAPLPEIEEWQVLHTLPYQGITEDMYHTLFEKIGRGEESRQHLFFCLRQDKDSVVYETSVPTETELASGGRYDNDGFGTFKRLTFYSCTHELPIAFSLQSGSVLEHVRLRKALDELDFLFIAPVVVVTDMGFGSDDSAITAYVRAKAPFLTLIPKDRAWIQAVVQEALPEYLLT